jgi:hypothetical protein
MLEFCAFHLTQREKGKVKGVGRDTTFVTGMGLTDNFPCPEVLQAMLGRTSSGIMLQRSESFVK